MNDETQSPKSTPEPLPLTALAFDKMVGRKIRLQRLQQGLTQKQLAARLHVSFQQVQKYEAGVNKMSAERLWQLAQIFETPLQYWVTGEEIFAERSEKQLPPSLAEDRRAIQLMHCFTKIEDEGMKTLLFAFTRKLAGKEEGRT